MSTKPQPLTSSDLYVNLVSGLFRDRWMLVFGSITATTAAFVVAYVLNELWAWAFVIAMPLITKLRFDDFNRYDKIPKTLDYNQATYWEFRYMVGAILHLVIFGVWTFMTFEASTDGFLQILTLTVTLCYSIGIATRNFTIRRGAGPQLIAVGAPIILACLLQGGLYPLLIPLVLLPLGLFIGASASRIRYKFLREIAQRRRANRLTMRFDAALNNMPHGLCMIDGNGDICVINQALRIIFSDTAVSLNTGASASAILKMLAEQGVLNSADTQAIIDYLQRPRCGDFHLTIRNNRGRSFEIAIRAMKDGAVFNVQDITERQNTQLAIERLAKLDTVTGLPNRLQFEHRLDKLVKSQADDLTAVLFIDLDDFKQVNDTLGHAHGDALLCVVAERLLTFDQQANIISRWGGDEFALLLCDVKSEAEILGIAEQIILALSNPCVIGGYTAIVGASIGVAFAKDADNDPVQVLKNADLALYAAKKTGRNNWRVFQPEMHEQAQLRRTLELDVRAAISSHEITPFYQPILFARSEQIYGFEALARWRHPTRGFVSPDRFISLVEELGLIEPLTDMILRQACMACASWPQNLTVAVNLSAAHFSGGDVVGIVKSALRDTKLPANRLELELTEGLLLDNRAATLQKIHALRDMGARIVLDDFGTGYSSLSYLLKFPIDKVKIDRSFVSGIERYSRERSLLDNLSQMLKQLGMSVTVEGVETDAQLAALNCCEGVATYQGYLFSKPVDLSETAALILRYANPSRPSRSLEIEWPAVVQA